MVDKGDRDSFVVGGQSSFSIDGDEYILKRAMSIRDDTTVYLDSVSIGILHHEGQKNIQADVEFYISEGDIATVLGYSDQDANGATSSYPITFKFTAHDGGVDTLTGTAIVSNPNINDTDTESKITATVRLYFRDSLSRS